MQLDMSFRTSAVTAAPLPWSRNFSGLAWNSVDSRRGLLWCTKSSTVSLTFCHTILQGLVATVVIPWHYIKCVAEWSHMKPAYSQQQWFHGIDSQPQWGPHQALIPSRPTCWKQFSHSYLYHVFIPFYLQLTVLFLTVIGALQMCCWHDDDDDDDDEPLACLKQTSFHSTTSFMNPILATMAQIRAIANSLLTCKAGPLTFLFHPVLHNTIKHYHRLFSSIRLQTFGFQSWFPLFLTFITIFSCRLSSLSAIKIKSSHTVIP